MQLTFDQIRAYFEARHPGQRIGTRNKASVKCVFHDDRTPSCTLFLDGAGGFHCNGCGASGNIFQFEARFSGCTLAEAEAKVSEVTGAKADRNFGSFAKLGPVVAAYDYRDDDDRVVFQKRRYQPEGEGKTFRVYRPGESGNWLAGIDPPDGAPTKRVLYNQPRVTTANVVLICEGEKDCDNVSQLGLYSDKAVRLAATCNFDGAWKAGEKPKWLASYSPYLTGKFVVIFQDNDESGEAWASDVAGSVYPFARSVKVLRLPGLPPKGDVSDWLENHTAKDLEGEIVKAPYWKPVRPQREYPMFQDAVEFAAEAPANVSWLVEGIIPEAGNGIICGDPKASKSFHAMDLAMSCACGVDWLGMRVPRRVKTVVVSREDSPGLTQRRIKRLICGKAAYGLNLSGWMLVNTRRHQADFKVTDEENLAALIEQIKRFGAELCVLDVFRSLHDSEENDNTQVPLVLQKINRIQTECNCAVALVHHINKRENENIFRGLRGASAIHGWMEWGIGITVTNPGEEDKADYVRRLEFENKEGLALPVYSQIREGDESNIRIQRVSRPELVQKTRSVAEIVSRKAVR